MKKIIFILVVVATGITACNELTSIDDVTTNEDHYSSNTDHYSINTNTVLGVMQSGVPTATVSFSDFNTEINDIAIENGHISGALIAQDIIDEGTYGYSYVYDYQITEISGDTTYFSSSLPVELDGLDFIPDVQNGGLRKKVTCSSRNCNGCLPRRGDCTDCQPNGEGGTCTKEIIDGGGGIGGVWSGVFTAIAGYLLGRL